MSEIVFVLVLVFIPVIAVVDSLVLGKALECENCKLPKDWRYFIIPSFLEIILFLAGYGLGVAGK